MKVMKFSILVLQTNVNVKANNYLKVLEVISSLKKSIVYLLTMVVVLGTLHSCSIKQYDDNAISIIQMTDPQFGFFTDNKSFERETENFTKAIQIANRLNPDFVIVTGDLVNIPFDKEQINEYKRVASLLKPTIPLYNVAGNHDVENVPTAQGVNTYNNDFGRDYYVIEHKGLFAVVLNSLYLHSPQNVMSEANVQEAWLKEKLAEAQKKKYQNTVVFLHHPLFLNKPDEADEYFNIPTETRMRYLELFKKYGVSHIFSGHYHRNAFGTYDGIEMVTTGPVGKPLGEDPSGFRIINVDNGKLQHRYFSLDSIPENMLKGY